jgi:hypothetical protein
VAARRAVVVGANGPAGLSELRYARNDTQRMHEVLAAPLCGFDVAVPEPQATSSQIRDLIYRSAEGLKPDDLLLCYFSGHGLLERGALFLLLDDSDTSRLLGTALPVSHLVEAFRHSPATNKVLILDCCHSGAVVDDAGFKGTESVSVQEAVNPEDFIVVVASERLERARELDVLKGGFLTKHLTDALSTNLFDATQMRGQLTLEDLRRWLPLKAREHNDRYPSYRVPEPFVYGKRGFDLCLTITDEWYPAEIIHPQLLSPLIVLPTALSAEERPRVYCMGKYPVTNREYDDVMGGAPRRGQRWIAGAGGGGAWHEFCASTDPDHASADQPVTCVSLEDAAAFAAGLKRRLPDDWKIGLPSPALWDFAAFGTEHPVRQPNAWMQVSERVLDCNAGATAKPFAIDRERREDRTNRLGLSDMIGNVWEWCASTWQRDKWDDYSLNFLISDDVTQTDDRRVKCQLSGGSFQDDLAHGYILLEEQQLRWGHQTRHGNVGFRIAAAVPPAFVAPDVLERLKYRRAIDKNAHAVWTAAGAPAITPAAVG